MKVFPIFALLLAFMSASAVQASDAEAQIKGVLSAQVDAWNRGDVPSFAASYATDCVFVGKQVTQGRAELLAHYKKSYPTREAMGHLSFSDLQVRLLTGDVATVTGEWHVERSGAGGKPVGGLFSLVFHRDSKEWKIVLDHTS